MKIFVSAYACEPYKGSEIGVGWHWILEMSKYYELWVMTRESNKINIENWMREHEGRENIHFVYYDLPKCFRWWKKRLRGVRIYYNLWQKTTNKIVKDTMKQNKISIYHLLTYGNALWPASKYGMSKTFVWGPVGGTDIVSKGFTRYYSRKARIIERVRRLTVKALPLNWGFIKRCKNADLILCKTQAMYECIPNKYKNKAHIFTDVGTDIHNTTNVSMSAQNVDEKNFHEDGRGKKYIKYTAAGRLNAWRGFDILIEAWTFCVGTAKFKNAKLEILGEGSDRKRLKEIIKKNHLEQSVNLVGEISIQEYQEKLQQTDVVINPTLREGGVTLAFDCVKWGKPLICVDTGGYTKCFKKDTAIILKKNNRSQLIADMSEAMLEMYDKNKRMKISKKLKKLAEENSWEEKGKEIKDIYDTFLGFPVEHNS